MSNSTEPTEPTEPLQAPSTEPATEPPAPLPDANPPAGGCYSRNPDTGELTLVTPSTIQE